MPAVIALIKSGYVADTPLLQSEAYPTKVRPNVGTARATASPGTLLSSVKTRQMRSTRELVDGALNRHYVPEFNPKGKEPHWVRRKLKRDQ